MLLVGAACAAAVAALFFGGESAGGGSTSEVAGLSPAARGLVVLGSVVLVPAAEELLFRGFLLTWLRRRFPSSRAGAVAAALVSAVIFAACHVAPPVMAYVFVLGLVLAWARMRFDSLLPGFLLHAANNALVTLVAVSAV